VERIKIAEGSPVKRMIPGGDQNSTGSWIKDNGRTYQPGTELPATEAAKLWDGWGTALKPAWEPVIVAMAPRDGTFANNALKWGVAGIWIDGGRLGLEGIEHHNTPSKSGLGKHRVYGDSTREQGANSPTRYDAKGRWPANFALVHHAECERVGTKRVKPLEGHRPNPVAVQSDGQIKFTEKAEGYQKMSYTDPDGMEEVAAWKCHPDCPVTMLGQQSGLLRTGAQHTSSLGQDSHQLCYGDGWRRSGQGASANSVGTAARFFYCAKASRSERDMGLNGEPMVSHAAYGDFKGTDDHASNLRGHQRNTHPTVKPLGIVEYLCKLTMTPARGVVFDPFIGSGTTAIAAKKLGRHYFGCDINPEYVEMARKRLSQVQLCLL
jgi:site-specific DNA-methyltransferase (adenine-specific)